MRTKPVWPSLSWKAGLLFPLFLFLLFPFAGALEFEISAELDWGGDKDFDLYGKMPDNTVMYWNEPFSWNGINWGGDAHPECSTSPFPPERISGTSTAEGDYEFWYSTNPCSSEGALFNRFVKIKALTNLKASYINSVGVQTDQVLEDGQEKSFLIPLGEGCTAGTYGVKSNCANGTGGVVINVQEAPPCTTDDDCLVFPQHYCQKWVCGATVPNKCELEKMPKWSLDDGTDTVKTSMLCNVNVQPPSNKCMQRACDGQGICIGYRRDVFEAGSGTTVPPWNGWPFDSTVTPYNFLQIVSETATCDSVDNSSPDFWDDVWSVAGGCCAYPVCPDGKMYLGLNAAGTRWVVYRYDCSSCDGENQTPLPFANRRCSNSGHSGVCCLTKIQIEDKIIPIIPIGGGGGGGGFGGTICNGPSCDFDPAVVGSGCLTDADCSEDGEYKQCEDTECKNYVGSGIVSNCIDDSWCAEPAIVLGPVADATVGDVKVARKDYYPKRADAAPGSTVVLHSDHDSDDADAAASYSRGVCPESESCDAKGPDCCLSYEWGGCTAEKCGSACTNCPPLSDPNAINPTFNVPLESAGREYRYYLVVRDGSNEASSQSVVSVTSVGPPVGGDLKIIKFEAAPIPLPASDPRFTSVAVSVKNISGALSPGEESGAVLLQGAAVSAYVTLRVADSLTGEKVDSVPAIISVPQTVPEGGTVDFTEADFGGDWESFNNAVAALLPSGYKLVADVYKVGAPDELNDSKSLFFSMGRTSAVPETTLPLLAVVAAAALFVLWRNRRTEKKES